MEEAIRAARAAASTAMLRCTGKWSSGPPASPVSGPVTHGERSSWSASGSDHRSNSAATYRTVLRGGQSQALKSTPPSVVMP
jgi:hypothetical protein